MVSQLLESPELQIFLPNADQSRFNQPIQDTALTTPIKNFKEMDYRQQDDYGVRSIDCRLNKMDTSFLKSKSIKVPRNVKYRCIIKQIRRIEKLLLLSQNNYQQFNDVFRYSIVSSHILNDYTSYFQDSQMKKSILNLREHTPRNDGRLFVNVLDKKYCEETIDIQLNSLLLKYYRMLILIKDRNFNIDLKLHYILLLLNAFYIIYSKKRQLLDTVKFKLMVILKEFLTNLENCDMLFHKLLLNYKTLQTYNIFDQESSLKQNNYDRNDFDIDMHNHDDDNDNDNSNNNNGLLSNFIENLLKSNLDYLFYIFRYKIEMILPLTDENSLTKYIEIYGLKLSDLKYYLNTDIHHLNEKAYRITITQKFLLCCLLSISFQEQTGKDKKNRITEFYYIFNINFLDKSCSESKNKDRVGGVLKHCESLTVILLHLSKSLESISNSLINYKNFLNLEIQASINNDITNNETYNELFQVTKLINKLELKLKVIKANISNNQNNNDQCNLLMNQLQNLHSIIHDTLISENIIYDRSSKPNQQGRRIVSIPINKSNRGFSLDIVKHNLDTYSDSHQSDSLNLTKINLSEKIEFKHIDSVTVSDDTETVDEETHTGNNTSVFYSDENDDTCVPSDLSTPIQSPNIYGKLLKRINICNDQDHDNDRKSYHYESLQKLSDEELRHKLNEKIINFANENRLGKNKLRAQKSFELLKRQQNKMPNTFSSTKPSFSVHSHNIYSKKDEMDANERTSNSKTISSTFSTEDTIPIIYEIRELMEF